VKRWNIPFPDLSLLLRYPWTFGSALVVAMASGLLRKYGGLALPESFTVYVVITVLYGVPVMGLLFLRSDLIRPIRIDFYVPKDEERERAQKWAERREKLFWLAIGIVFTVVAELIAYGLLKKLGLL